MTAIEAGGDLAQLDAAIEGLPNQAAVFVLWPKEGQPYLSKTGLLRRRLLRLLKEREKPSRLLNLRHTIARIEYRLTGSAFESAVVQYEQARRLFPENYLEVVKLRMPPYVKIILANEFPRSHITTHLTRTAGLYLGPFRSRASAERFEAQFLDLFQMRRCQEDLVPGPGHPGCIYGEMGMCLRPCQQVVGPAEYGAEVERVVEFLRTGGRSLVDAITHSRDRLS
jgi:excinuclease UvrABC nuclease subunit